MANRKMQAAKTGAETLSDATGAAAFRLGRNLNQFYFWIVQWYLLNPAKKKHPVRQEAEQAFARCTGLTQSFAAGNRGIDRRIRIYGEEWFGYLACEDYTEDWWAWADSLSHAEGEFSRDDFREWSHVAEVEFGELIDWLARALGRPDGWLLQLGVIVDQGTRPPSMWRGMLTTKGKDEHEVLIDGSPSQNCAPANGEDQGPSLQQTSASHASGSCEADSAVNPPKSSSRFPLCNPCSPNALPPEIGWRERLQELLQTSPLEPFRDELLPDAVPKVIVDHFQRLVDANLTGVLKPHWCPVTRRLFFGGFLLKDWKRHPAKNQEQLVQAFEDVGWASSVEAPPLDKKTLDDAVANFNKSLKVPLIRLWLALGGDHVRWEVVSAEG